MIVLLIGCVDFLWGDPVVEEGEDLEDTGVACDETPSHDVDIQPIWDQSCATCHSGVEPDGDLSLNSAYGEIVSVSSSESGVNLVEPGDLSGSLLWDMVESGEMPLGSSALPDDELDLIACWILGGAPE